LGDIVFFELQMNQHIDMSRLLVFFSKLIEVLEKSPAKTSLSKLVIESFFKSKSFFRIQSGGYSRLIASTIQDM